MRPTDGRIVLVLLVVATVVCAVGCPDCRTTGRSAMEEESHPSAVRERDSERDAEPPQRRESDEAIARRGPETGETARDSADDAREAGARRRVGRRAGPVELLALGDSYTTGMGVSADERWPTVLADRLRSSGLPVESPRLVATGGWLSSELLDGLREASLDREFDAVIVLIGTNDALSDIAPDRFRRNLRQILERAVELAGGKSSRVVALTIPDYSVTPVGERVGVEEAREEVGRFNETIRDEAKRAGIRVVDLVPVSRRAKGRPELLADALHPAARMHEMWVEAMMPTVREIVQTRRAP